MARKKLTAFVWVCSGEGHKSHENGSGHARPELVKELTRNKNCPVVRKHMAHKAKAVKKAGTKKLANKK